MIYELPLEPIEMRYTEQWYDWFDEIFTNSSLDHTRIDGETISPDLDEGFLDWQKTFIWKFHQLKNLFTYELEEDDWVFIPDGEMPGIESIEYYRKFKDKDVNVAQIWHAGTYDKWDLTYQKGLARQGSKLEEAWMDIADLIFVATEYHKNLITKNRHVDESKIKVTGLPVDVEKLWDKYRSPEKKKKVVFTGRLSEEKGLDKLETMKMILSPTDYELIKTQEQKLPKEEYYNLLGEVEFIYAPSKQETFGYGVVEGMAMGAKPIVPDGLSFTDYVPEKYRQETFNLLKHEADQEYLKSCVQKYQYQNVILRMLLEMFVYDG